MKALEVQVDLLTRLLASGMLPQAKDINSMVHPTMFTAKQHAVIQALHQGWSTKKIAEKLMTSDSTAKGHIKAVMDKLNARSRPMVIEQTMRLMEMDAVEYQKLTGISQGWARDDGECEESNRIVWEKTR